MINIIHIFGASGSGTSTLGEAIEQQYGYKWLDTDNYFWLPTNPPFVQSRPYEERVKLLQDDIIKYQKCVISGSICKWGDIFMPLFDLALYIDTPTEIRIERLRRREYARFGERILEGGDMYSAHKDFIEWAKNYDTAFPPARCRATHEEWIKKLTCPILRLDGTKPVENLLFEIEEKFLLVEIIKEEHKKQI